MTDGRRIQKRGTPTTIPGIPKPPADASPGLRMYLSALSEALEIRLGRKGDPRDRAITLRELIDSGLAVELSNNPYNGSGNDFAVNTEVPNIDFPPAPANFSATGAFSNIALFWNWPGDAYRGHSFTEIWRNDADILGNALLVGVSTGIAYTDAVGGGASYYYWARHVNVNGRPGPWSNNGAGVFAETQPDIEYLLELLTESITSSELAEELSSPIAQIPGLTTFTGYTVDYTGDSLVTRVGDVEGDLYDENGNLLFATAQYYNQIVTEVFPDGYPPAAGDESAIAAVASSVTTLGTGYNDPNTGAASNLSLQQAMTAQIGVNGNLKGQYTVKIDNNGAVAGFGLASTAVNDTTDDAFSEFYINADRFAIYKDGNDNGTPVAPFVVTTSTQVLEGVTVPPGVYIDTAFINKGRVLSLIAGSVVADYVEATAALSAPSIFGGTFNIGSLNKPTADPRTWSVTGTNRNSNFSVDANGIMHATAAELNAVTVRATDGTVLLDAGGTNAFSGSNLVPNGDLYGGVGQTSNNVWGDNSENFEIIPFWEVADANNGRSTSPDVSYWTPSFGGVIQLFYGSTFRMAEFVPAYSGQVYYLAVNNNMNNNVLQWQAQIQFADSNKQYVNGTQISLSPTSPLWDEPPTSGARFSVAKITVPANSNIRYMRLRFYGGPSTGTSSDYVNITSVYLGQVPPVIGPKYASTFIRDLAVDTFQIAGEAVTLPEISTGDHNASVGYTEVELTGVSDRINFSWSDVRDRPSKIILAASIQVQGDTNQRVTVQGVIKDQNNTQLAIASQSFRETDGGQTVVLGMVDLDNYPSSITLKLFCRVFLAANSTGASRQIRNWTLTAWAAKK